MKIEKKTLNKQDVLSSGKNRKMRLSENSNPIIFKMFTSNVYSNPIGSFIREITSNCYDSHAEANVNDPVVVKLEKKEEDFFLSFIDVGVGMSPERMNNVYSIYFETTKDDTNNEIGGFGIGGKTPMAYRRSTGNGENDYDNSFFINTIFNGVEYHYVVYEGEESPEFDLLFKDKTTKRNGTEIKIPILKNDINKVIQEIKKQLYYFENIIFEGFENYSTTLNDYKIFKGKSFIYRPNNTYEDIHVCLGKIAYPIDFNILGLSKYDYKIPIGINVNIGDLSVTISRESLDYSSKNIDFLIKKINEVTKELSEMLSKQHENVINFFDYEKIRNNSYTLYLNDDVSIGLTGLKNISNKGVDFKNFKYNNIKVIPTFTELLNFISNRNFYGKLSGWGKTKKKILSQIKSDNISQNPQYFYYSNDKFLRKINKQKYILSLVNNFKHITFNNYINKVNSKDDNVLLAVKSEFNDTFHDYYNKIEKELASTEQVKSLILEVYNFVIKNVQKYDDVVIEESFLESLKLNRGSKAALKQEITLSIISKRNNIIKINDTFENLLNYKGTIIYGNTDYKNIAFDILNVYNTMFGLENYINLSSGYSNLKRLRGTIICTVSKTNEKYLKQLPQAIHINDFKLKFLHRKYDNIVKVIVHNDLLDKINDCDYNYKRYLHNDKIINVNKNYGKTLNIVLNFKDNKTNLNVPLLLMNYIDEKDIENYKNSKEIKLISKAIKHVNKVIEKNKTTLNFINSNNYFDNEKFIKFLKKVLVF